jgi:hypothetical protein
MVWKRSPAERKRAQSFQAWELCCDLNLKDNTLPQGNEDTRGSTPLRDYKMVFCRMEDLGRRE